MSSWTFELISYLNDAPWPATKEELIDYTNDRLDAPQAIKDSIIDNLSDLELDFEEGEPEVVYDSIQEIWPDCPQEDDDFFFDEDEY